MVKVAVACQGGGMHGAFEVGVLTEILDAYQQNRFDLVGLSGTSAGALCALLVWFGLAPKKSGSNTVADAKNKLNDAWDEFVAQPGTESLLNQLTYNAFKAEETEVPLLGLSAVAFGLNPYRGGFKALAACLPSLGVRQKYFDLHAFLEAACPNFDTNIDWPNVKMRLLIGASEVVKGFETVFDSNVRKLPASLNTGMMNPDRSSYWRQLLPLSLEGVAASGTLPVFREAEHIGSGYYWDGLYSQNPPVREFFKAPKQDIPDEIWIVRINPQQWPHVPDTHVDIQDRQNELMGNLSLTKELDFILKVNEWINNQAYQNDQFVQDRKLVTVRTIKMTKQTADGLHYSSKFNRDKDFLNQLRKEGHAVAQSWLANWPNNVGNYPQDT